MNQRQLAQTTVIAAMASNCVVGINGKLPWTREQLPWDLSHFKKITTGGKPNAIIMGRRTHESLGGRLLPHRTHIVVSTSMEPGKYENGIIVFSDILSASNFATNFFSDVHFIGGTEIWRFALQLVDEIYLTRVHAEFKGDTFFPAEEPHHTDYVRAISEFYPAKSSVELDATLEIWRRQR